MLQAVTCKGVHYPQIMEMSDGPKRTREEAQTNILQMNARRSNKKKRCMCWWEKYLFAKNVPTIDIRRNLHNSTKYNQIRGTQRQKWQKMTADFLDIEIALQYYSTKGYGQV